ncbi:MAG: lytic murein transglycosylase, partial [Beijerinckiaceae bacterium]
MALAAGSVAAAIAPARAQGQEFRLFLEGMRADARAAGVSMTTFDAAVQGLTFDPGPGRASGGQGEFQRPFWDYVNGAVSPARI